VSNTNYSLDFQVILNILITTDKTVYGSSRCMK